MASAEGGHLPSAGTRTPIEFLPNMLPAPLDPLEAEPPAVELVDPTPAASLYPVRDTARTTRLSREEVDNLLTATSEAVTNAVIHGRPPLMVRVWAAPARMVVTVIDGGAGPSDSYVGLAPDAQDPTVSAALACGSAASSSPRLRRGEEGFRIRLLAGRDPK